MKETFGRLETKLDVFTISLVLLRALCTTTKTTPFRDKFFLPAARLRMGEQRGMREEIRFYDRCVLSIRNVWRNDAVRRVFLSLPPIFFRTADLSLFANPFLWLSRSLCVRSLKIIQGQILIHFDTHSVGIRRCFGGFISGSCDRQRENAVQRNITSKRKAFRTRATKRCARD